MVSDFDTPRYLQLSSICCEVLFRTESRPLEIGALGIFAYTSMVLVVLALRTGEGLQQVFLERFLPTQTTPVKQPTGRSVSGGAIMCAGACVCWFSRTQKCVTLPTSEAEYVALGDSVK